jgi:hypothetical protein
MIEWFAIYWTDLLTGFVFGLLCSLIGNFWIRLCVSAVLFVLVYQMMLSAVAHAGFRWDNLLLARTMMGVLLGCLARPTISFVFRSLSRSQ